MKRRRTQPKIFNYWKNLGKGRSICRFLIFIVDLRVLFCLVYMIIHVFNIVYSYDQYPRDGDYCFTVLINNYRSYGSVWKAIHLKTNTVTAIKKVPVENDLDEILNEIKIMKSCRSPYIISYYGSYFKENELWVCFFGSYFYCSA